MFIKRALQSGVCLGAMVSATAAFADITAQEAFDAWQEQMTRTNGISLSYANADMNGDTLTITGLDIDLADETLEGLDYDITVDAITFTENSDGTVTNKITSPLTISMTNSLSPNAGGAQISIDATNGETVFSGSPDNLTMTGTYPQVSASVDQIIENGMEMPMEISVTMYDAETVNTMVLTGDRINIVQSGSIAKTDLFVDFIDGADGLKLSGQLFGTAYQGTSEMPADMSNTNPADFMSMGIVGELTYTNDSAQFLAMLQDFSGVTNVTLAHNGGETIMTFDEVGFGFDTSAKDISLQMAGGAVPLPVDVTLGELGMDMTMPLAATDGPVNFGIGFDVIDLGINELIWSLIDPTGALPHDPITAQLGLTGTGKLFFDLTDPEQAEAMAMGAVPGEIYSASIDRLKIALAGAMLTGTGDFTFDNGDMFTFPGMPRPEGSLTLSGEGINGLLDKIAGMGLPVGEQIMGARMMLGMFSTVTGDDQIESTVEVNDQGHVLVNGQRMR